MRPVHPLPVQVLRCELVFLVMADKITPALRTLKILQTLNSQNSENIRGSYGSSCQYQRVYLGDVVRTKQTKVQQHRPPDTTSRRTRRKWREPRQAHISRLRRSQRRHRNHHNVKRPAEYVSYLSTGGYRLATGGSVGWKGQSCISLFLSRRRRSGRA